jgi:hypothetical protein
MIWFEVTWKLIKSEMTKFGSPFAMSAHLRGEGAAERGDDAFLLSVM